MTTRLEVTAALLEALARVGKGLAVSNTAVRTLAKLGWVSFTSVRVYEAGAARRLITPKILRAGRAALEAVAASERSAG